MTPAAGGSRYGACALMGIAKLMRHLETAKLLIMGIEESLDRPSMNCPPEHSRQSILRRCIQARQELLRVYQEVN